MQTNCTHIPYKSTGYFSKLILDYLDEKPELRSFYKHPVSLEGIKSAIAERQSAPSHRQLLVAELRKQYAGISLTDLQERNLSLLEQPTTFTICTAHQPNIFTGHLYFIYKIVHAIKLAQTLSNQLSEYNFVPVFYMGSEDADLEELGHIDLNGEKLVWQTNQTGSVGRMKVDAAFINLIERISGELSVLPYGSELIKLFKLAYTIGTNIQQATLVLVNELFKSFGLLVLIPDSSNLKRPFNDVVKNELTNNFSYPIVQETAEQLGKNYKVQTAGREINLFYLVDNSRERITEVDGTFRAASFEWTKDEMLNEVDDHPERFSANVILRGVFQEMLLPNVAFIGGGGELAYWLELKKVFEVCEVPFPVLVLRNSFLLADKKSTELADKLGFDIKQTFLTERRLLVQLVNRESDLQLNLDDELAELQQFYANVRQMAADIDITLSEHVSNLYKKARKGISELELKMLRAENKKFETEIRNLKKLKGRLFPQKNLQERIENFSPYYANYGPSWITGLYNASLSLDQQFTILEISD